MWRAVPFLHADSANVDVREAGSRWVVGYVRSVDGSGCIIGDICRSSIINSVMACIMVIFKNIFPFF